MTNIDSSLDPYTAILIARRNESILHRRGYERTNFAGAVWIHKVRSREAQGCIFIEAELDAHRAAAGPDKSQPGEIVNCTNEQENEKREPSRNEDCDIIVVRRKGRVVLACEVFCDVYVCRYVRSSRGAKEEESTSEENTAQITCEKPEDCPHDTFAGRRRRPRFRTVSRRETKAPLASLV